MPTLNVVAGPSGCGKSTLTRTTWFIGVEVIDPDAIARDTKAGNPGQAARETLRRRRAAVAAGRTLVVETTLAGSGVLRLMETARKASYRIVLHYVSVDSPDQALIRIRNRVVLGGLELTRIRGHLTLWGGGIHHAEIKTAVRAGVPAPDG